MVKTSIGTGAMVLALALASTASPKTTTLTGTVTDAMCGAEHMMKGSAAECTRGCVKKGSDYALVVKDKVYTLKTSSAAAKTRLDKLAGETAKVTGDLDGDTVQVTSVQAAAATK